MKIEVIKPNESAWKFPCKGINKVTNLIVGFSKNREGVVLNVGNSTYNTLYEYSECWDMSSFVPLEKEEKEPIDLNKVELPTWAKDNNGNLIYLKNIDNNIVWYVELIEDNRIYAEEHVFKAVGKKYEWLNSLEIFPKGSVIKITI